MKKLAFLASVTLLTLGISSGPGAANSCGLADLAALQCARDFHGNYKVKNFDIHYGDVPWGLEEPDRGQSCLDALNDLESYQGFYLHSSTGNALKDTYILRRCVPG